MPESNSETQPETQTEAQPETDMNSDYERIFGSGGGDHPVATDETGMLLDFDPSEAITPVGPGKYVMVVSEPPKHQISQNGNPMMAVTFLITEGEQTGSLQWRRYMLKGKGGGWTVEFLNAIGLEEEAKGLKKINPADIEGRRVIGHVRKQKGDDSYTEIWKVERHPDGPIPD
jgi:hypothetical protein